MTREGILSYLAALEENNSREWFHSNRARYQDACRSFEELVSQLILICREFDGTLPPLNPRELTFKLMRDTRFSRDKSPYLPAMRAHIGSKGKLPIPVGYYVMLRPGGKSFFGGGLFTDVFKEATDLVRAQLSAQGERWQNILEEPGFRARFQVQGTALKNVPRGYDPAHPQAEYLKYKSWYLEFPLTDEQVISPDFFLLAGEIFRTMQPFNAFLNGALASFQMPQRP